jgi:hypothetical protein
MPGIGVPVSAAPDQNRALNSSRIAIIGLRQKLSLAGLRGTSGLHRSTGGAASRHQSKGCFLPLRMLSPSMALSCATLWGQAEAILCRAP